MKKFLSLVLALVMTMSLVTISAGATEYKDLTDKDEIQYEEAVAVLNRIGVISGYDDGSFRPETELTRGAAAKIIVSLMIGPEAASALPNNYSPYPDVPAGHTFAGVISYCKTAGYISGYGDGTFKPANSLTGYAFAKMLLGALGYKSEVEGFTGTGWTMNVAKFGNMANLFNRINFDGAASVNREQACQLALNTLKATMVEYTGGFNVTAGDATVVGAQTRTYVTSNQEYARHISERRAGGTNTVGGNAVSDNHYTVEFGEEHFKDLRMVSERGTADDFGRPSNEWSYKKVTIGTFPVEPDFTYTTQVTHATESTDAAKVRALGLSGYETEGVVRYTTTGAGITDKTVVFENGVVGELANNKVADIADLTDNGTLVEVYVSEEDADFIETVVVVKTQLMEIKRVGSEAVALDKKDADADGEVFYGYNQAPIDVVVNDVEIDDDCFKVLSEMKAGDLVAVVPVAPDHPATAPTKYDVGRVYAPESVSGKLSNVKQFTKSGAEETIAVTVGDTAYNVALWNKDLHKVNGDKVKITRKDVTLYLDEYGNALLAEGVGDTSNWMVIGSYSQGLVNNRIVNYVNGWDIGGEELSLNIGSTTTANKYITGEGYQPGCLVYYTNDVNSNTAEWLLSNSTTKGVFNVFTGKQADDAEPYKIEASNKRILLEGFNDATVNPDDGTGDGVATVDSGIKFIYVTVDNSDGEVDSVEFRSGVQAATNDELKTPLNNRSAQAAVSLEDYKAGNLKDVVTVESGVKAVVIKRESSEATVNNLLYIEKVIKTATLDTEGQPVYVYQCYDTEGEMIEVASYRKINPGNWVKQNAMATPEAAKGIEGVTEDNFKRLTGYGADGYQAETWQRSAAVAGTKLINVNGTNKYLLTTNGTYGNTGRAVSAPDISKAWDRDKYDLGVGNGSNMIDAKGAEIIDLRTDPNRRLIDSIDQIKDAINGKGDFQYKTVNGAQVETKGYDLNATILFNDNTDSNDFRTAYVIIIHSITEKDGSSTDPEPPVTGKKVTLTLEGNWTGVEVWAKDGTEKLTGIDGSTVNKQLLKFEIDKNDTVMVKKTGLAANGSYVVSGEGVTVKDNIFSIKMTNDKTLDIADFSDPQNVSFDIVFEAGVTPTKFMGVKGPDVVEVQATNVGNNTWRVTDRENLCQIYVTTTATQYAFATTDKENAVTGPNNGETKGIANTGTAQQIDLGAPITADVYVYGATKVNVEKMNPGYFGWGAPGGFNATTDTAIYYARPDVVVSSENVAPDDDRSAIIVNATGGVATEKLSTSGRKVGNNELTLTGAFTVTLDGVKVTVNGSEVTDEFYVAYGATCPTPTATKGNKVIDVTDKQPTKASEYTAGAVNADLSLAGAVEVKAAATSPNLDSTNPITYKTPAGDARNTLALVKVGTEITVTGATTNADNKTIKAVVTGSAPEKVITPDWSEPSNQTATTPAKAIYTVGTEGMTLSEV